MTISKADPVTASPAAPPPTTEIPRSAGVVQRIFRAKPLQASLTFVVFLVIFAIFGATLGGTFLNVNARVLNIHQNVPLLLLGLAAMITLVAGLFDLSIGSMASLCAFLAIGLRTQQSLPFWLVLVICVVVGLVGGLINGLLVERLHVNAFIATLGTGGIYLGISSVYSKGAAITPKTGDPDIPTWFTTLGAFTAKPPSWMPIVLFVAVALLAFGILRGMRPKRRSIASWTLVSIGIVAVAVAVLLALGVWSWLSGASWLVGVLLVAGILIWGLLDYTVYGRNLKATGSNPLAARLAGVNTSGVVIRAFMIGGVLAAIAGVTLSSTQGSVSPDIAGAYLLPAFSAAFLSTVVFSTGRFTVWGTLVGGIFVVWVGQGLIIAGLPATWNSVVNGALLVLAVALSTVMRRANR